MKIAVIGAGSWGTALAQLLACNGNEVGLWARKPEVVEAVNASHANPRYLSFPGASWPRPPTRRPWRARRPPSS